MRYALAALALLVALPAAAVPTQLTHQGSLSDPTGAPLVGVHSLRFRLYADAASGPALWDDTVNAELVDGRFSIVLGAGGSPLDSALFDGNVRYLGLSVDDAPELSPRLAIVSVPYAVRAGVAESLAAPVDWSELTGVPESLDDGDADSLADLACASSQVPVFDGAAWACGDLRPASVDVSTLSGTVSVDNLPVGTGPSNVAAGDHTHSFGQITGVAALSQLPVGTGSDNVAAGDHDHALADLSGDLPLSRTTGDLPLSRTTGDLPLSRTTGDLPLSRTTGNLDGSRIGGSVAFSSLPVGTGATQVSRGDHTHAGLWTVTSGSLRAGSQPVVVGSGNPVAELTVEGGVRVGTAANNACNSSREGVLSWNSTAKALQVCNGTAWVAVSAGVARTCKEHLAFDGTAGDGLYSIDPDGSGGAAPFQTWCDMTNGGWTLLAKTEFSGLTSAERDIIRLGNWNTYSATGYGDPASGSRIYWMPLTQWNALTSAFPSNVFRITDSRIELRMSNLSIGNATQEHPINWSGPVSGYQQIHGNSDNAIKGARFTTRDNDNDVWPSNCAVDNVGQNGGFWYTNCYQTSMLHANGNLYSWQSNVDYTVTHNRLWFREE